jgi:hypothetical protein
MGKRGGGGEADAKVLHVESLKYEGALWLTLLLGELLAFVLLFFCSSVRGGRNEIRIGSVYRNSDVQVH